jgi:hypothetical protein
LTRGKAKIKEYDGPDTDQDRKPIRILTLENQYLRWVADHKSLWCTQPLNGHPEQFRHHIQSENYSYTHPNRKAVTDLWTDVTFTTELASMEKKLKEEDLADLPG